MEDLRAAIPIPVPVRAQARGDRAQETLRLPGGVQDPEGAAVQDRGQEIILVPVRDQEIIPVQGLAREMIPARVPVVAAET